MQMETVFVVPVFHVGGSLVRNADGILVYEGGSVEKFDRMDLDLVNFLDLVKLLEDELGYKTEKKLHWLDVADDNLESGLYRLLGDKEINAMRKNVLKNFGLSEEFHIYVEHEEEDSSSSSTDDGGYESAEDELYRPPKFVSEDDDTDSEVEGSSRKCSQKSKRANPKHKGRKSVSNAGKKGKGVLRMKKDRKNKGCEKGAKKGAAGPKAGPKPKAAMGGPSVNIEEGLLMKESLAQV
ncbi:hypothetical protein PIB30_089235 [Stylosanthes scabra]|uniref:PB1-like domain-containing protein n=1 Tax=Stylosanthes scabra TaxID=79078 RepID=A0ABU6WU08_9FABA|nr:hypothetical protein [Stylosanthes scabra]